MEDILKKTARSKQRILLTNRLFDLVKVISELCSLARGPLYL
jgi:hypothetical protein